MIALTGLIFSSLFFLILARAVYRVLKRRRKRDDEPIDGRRCKCGYPLVGVSIPRCPECGRAVGFDVSFAELGISEEEVRANIEAKRLKQINEPST